MYSIVLTWLRQQGQIVLDEAKRLVTYMHPSLLSGLKALQTISGMVWSKLCQMLKALRYLLNRLRMG